ncbi:MAG: NAD-dependent DNA ligase LigA [Candidatus Kerfeldbacteria bacterium]
MVPEKTRLRIEKLRKEIERHRYLYHVLDTQEISDAALDSLKHELEELERRYPECIMPDSPTQRIGGAPLPELTKVRHETRMLSFDDVFVPEELEKWNTRWRKLAPGITTDYLVDCKLDGLAIRLVYERGLLTLGATRGDGTTGEDVTHNVRTIEAIPLRLETGNVSDRIRRQVKGGRVELRGEIVMLKKDFEALNKRQKAAGQQQFANPRNVAAGSVRQLDPKLAASRPLDFYAWELTTDLGQDTLDESYAIIKKLGVKVNPITEVCRDLDSVRKFHERIYREREKMKFWIDGVVVKVNRRDLWQRLGVVGKSPRAAVAYKFPAEQATTVVEDIQVQVGRTGALTPVAHFRPVHLAGTVVARATLHNADEIARLDVRKGDTVILQKAGDIIPDVVNVLTKLRPRGTPEYRMPSHCPVCHHMVHRKKGEVIYYCPNPRCPAKQRESLYHVASKKALDIDGLGPSTIDVLVDEGLVRAPADFFRLTADKLVGLPLFAEKKAENLIDSIRSSRKVALDRFIYGLGIRHVGEQTAIDLAHHFKDIERFMSASPEEITHVPNIGEVVARSVHHYFTSSRNRELVRSLIQETAILRPPKLVNTRLTGKIVVVTGTLNAISREEAHERIRASGGTVATSVGPKTSYVVAGENPGSKLATAEKLDIEVVDEQKFLRMVE